MSTELAIIAQRFAASMTVVKGVTIPDEEIHERFIALIDTVRSASEDDIIGLIGDEMWFEFSPAQSVAFFDVARQRELKYQDLILQLCFMLELYDDCDDPMLRYMAQLRHSVSGLPIKGKFRTKWFSDPFLATCRDGTEAEVTLDDLDCWWEEALVKPTT